MGYYLNHPDDADASKAVIVDQLVANGARVISRGEAAKLPARGWVNLCLVANGGFNALGVMFDERETKAFTYKDGREQAYLTAPVKTLKPFMHASAFDFIAKERGQ